MDDKELSALKALAEAATPGPWVDGYHTVYQDDNIGGEEICRRMSVEDSSYIAAANPDAILSLISHVESADLLGEHYEKLCQSKDARIAELEADKEGWRKAAIGAAVDLSGLTRYIECCDGIAEHEDGQYVKFTDIQALLTAPARDVGGLTEVRNSVIEEVAKLIESTDDHIWANTCGRKIRALATSPAPSVKQEAVNAEQIVRKVRELTLDYAAMHFDGKSRLISPAYVSEYLRELKNAPLHVSVIIAAPSASQGDVKVPEGFALVPKDPTPEMVHAARFYSGELPTTAATCYRAMIAAAPAPSVMDGEGVTDTERLTVIENAIRERGYFYIHDNKAKSDLIGLGLLGGSVRSALDAILEVAKK